MTNSLTTLSTAAAVRPQSGTRDPASPAATSENTASPGKTDDVVLLNGLPVSPGLQIFLAKGPGYWTDVEGADDYPVVKSEPVHTAVQPAIGELHTNHTGTLTVLEPPSEGLKAFLAKPADFWTNTDYT